MSTRPIPLQTARIIASVDQHVGWLTINNPERRNALSLEMWQGIADAMTAFEADDDVRVVVMLGAGGKAFASGADISEFEKNRANAEQKQQYAETASRGQTGVSQLTKPLIAMVDGYCIGGGLALALSADLRFVTQQSQFGIPAAKLGLGYEYAGLAVLARLVGPSTAKDMLFSARFLDAQEALRVGLVNFIVADGELLARVSDYAAKVAANAPLTVRASKAALKVFERYSVNPEAASVDALVNGCFDSDDYREGRRAFMDKRTPVFTGR